MHFEDRPEPRRRLIPFHDPESAADLDRRHPATVDLARLMMYTYITMERTQIYLNETQSRELDRRARLQGTSRSHLIREAIETYLARHRDPKAFKAALDGIAGMWADRNDLDEVYESLQEGDRRRLRRLFPDLNGPQADEPDPSR